MKIFSWDITSRCNFKCFYCFFNDAGWENLAKLEGLPKSPEVIEDAWYKIYKSYNSCKIYITGGEPFCYPNFVDIINRITKYHKVHITTNLSIDLDEFIKKVDINKVELNTTFHPLYIDLDKFIFQVLKLKKNGFNVGICYLLHPVQIREILNYKKYFKKHNLNLTFVKFYGTYNGKNYPKDYTEEELTFFSYVENLDSEKDSYYTFLDKIRTRKKFEHIGENSKENCEIKLCPAGKDYASITVDGRVRRCGQSEDYILGNIFSGEVKLLKENKRCLLVCKCNEYKYF